VYIIKKQSIFFCQVCSACIYATFPGKTGITKRKKIKKLKQRTVACVQPLPKPIGTKLQKTLTTHRMLGVLILKKIFIFMHGKKLLRRGKV